MDFSLYRFNRSHLWIKIKDNQCIIGLTDYIQNTLGDIIYVEPPLVGKKIKRGKEITVIESMKTAKSLTAPVSGIISGYNTKLDSEPELINNDPYGNGWICILDNIKQKHIDDFISKDEYDKFCNSIPSTD